MSVTISSFEAMPFMDEGQREGSELAQSRAHEALNNDKAPAASCSLGQILLECGTTLVWMSLLVGMPYLIGSVMVIGFGFNA